MSTVAEKMKYAHKTDKYEIMPHPSKDVFITFNWKIACLKNFLTKQKMYLRKC